MAQKILSGERVYNGRYGKLSWNKKELAEVKSFQLVTKMNKQKIPRVGAATDASVVETGETTGQMVLHRINSVIQQELAKELAKGKWPTFELVSTEANKNTGRVITIVARGVSFDDITWADWSADKLSEVTLSFTTDTLPYFKNSDNKMI